MLHGVRRGSLSFGGATRSGAASFPRTDEAEGERRDEGAWATGRVQGGVGDRSGEGLPGTISNPAVKLASAEGTARVTVWEGTSLPTRLHAAAAPLPPFAPPLQSSFTENNIK